MTNRHGIPILAPPPKQLVKFRGRAPFPPIIDRKVDVTCRRLLVMERELSAVLSAQPDPGAMSRCIMRAHRDVIFRRGGAQ